jgi:MFS family permease
MGIRSLAIVVYCTTVGSAILYTTQPLLPLLAEQWGRPIADTALLTTATMIPLALGPLLYGYVLEHVSTKHMLTASFGILTLHSVLSAFLNHLETERKGLINGLYVSAYYCGGALGSYFPGFIYQSIGWSAFIGFLLLLLLMLTLLSLMLRHAAET